MNERYTKIEQMIGHNHAPGIQITASEEIRELIQKQVVLNESMPVPEVYKKTIENLKVDANDIPDFKSIKSTLYRTRWKTSRVKVEKDP